MVRRCSLGHKKPSTALSPLQLHAESICIALIRNVVAAAVTKHAPRDARAVLRARAPVRGRNESYAVVLYGHGGYVAGALVLGHVLRRVDGTRRRTALVANVSASARAALAADGLYDVRHAAALARHAAGPGVWPGQMLDLWALPFERVLKLDVDLMLLPGAGPAQHLRRLWDAPVGGGPNASALAVRRPRGHSTFLPAAPPVRTPACAAAPRPRRAPRRRCARATRATAGASTGACCSCGRRATRTPRSRARSRRRTSPIEFTKLPESWDRSCKTRPRPETSERPRHVSRETSWRDFSVDYTNVPHAAVHKSAALTRRESRASPHYYSMHRRRLLYPRPLPRAVRAPQPRRQARLYS